MKTSEVERVSKIIYNAFLTTVASYRNIDEMIDLIKFYEKPKGKNEKVIAFSSISLYTESVVEQNG